MPTRVGSNRHPGAANQSMRACSEARDPAAAELPPRVGAREGGQGVGRTFHRLFWPLTETGGQRERERSKPGSWSTEYRDQTVSVCEELGLADKIRSKSGRQGV